MLAVSAVFVAAATVLLIEASLVYYQLPAAPAWLRERKDLQVTFSSLLVNGAVAALFMMGQYLVDIGHQPVSLIDIAMVAAVVVAFVVTWRPLHAFHRRLSESAVAKDGEPVTAEPVFRRAA